ncbi:MAG TPA: glycosyltransferase [Candidatus Saccharimonadales bacterium]|nr:glycosyltransferase [Candidatus Saccharimonadales bacterium]
MREPLVSVVVTTKNNHTTLGACLASIAGQTYPRIELLVVDNSSTDDTVAIARHYTSAVFTYGPERSAQRNYAAAKANGDYVFIVDSDMELGERVVEACVGAVQSGAQAVIVPEESFGEGFWARCKRLERSFYVGIDAVEAARFFALDVYLQAGGYDEAMTGGEDWDLTRRVRALTPVVRVNEFIRHNEGRVHFAKSARKMYYYAQHAGAYFAANPTPSVLRSESGPLGRYKLFFSKPVKLLREPHVAFGMLLFKATEYAAAGLGYLRGSRVLTKDAREA